MIDLSNSIVESQANFALKTLVKLSNVNESLVVSPFSLTLALTLCFIGSKGKTNNDINKLLFPGINENEFVNYLQTTADDIKELSESYTTVYLGNKMYLKKNLKINNDYKEKIKKYFKSDIENIDFTNANDSTKIINEYISNSTNGRIKNFISSKDFTSKIDSIIASSITFQSSWKERFKKN
ncbi:Serpin domain-containing protein [Strongyloides ratti]|uniref:Serpin domain-containing protein n=1 Tax=Strongyloides ratti TaxID=34506 RepID=A0A090LAK2_STRRB|nr:Serpin domain-containing protein [Strongyloides ratti]CEF66767.1 Serpin domain-containing protein [Strongyloides ratti]